MDEARKQEQTRRQMDDETRAELILVTTTLDYMSSLENQDLGLVIECGQAMLNDILGQGYLSPIREYVSRYCDVYDDEDHLAEMLDELHELVIRSNAITGSLVPTEIEP